jgi:K(+)-stimulated pyrophosphate-energized sodium pump
MLFTSTGVFGAIMVGLVVGTLMSIITEYYTAMGKRPVMSIVRQSSTGHATNIIGGLAVGMESTVLPIIVLAGGIFGSYLCSRFVRCGYRSCRYDGNYSYAISY